MTNANNSRFFRTYVTQMVSMATQDSQQHPATVSLVKVKNFTVKPNKAFGQANRGR